MTVGTFMCNKTVKMDTSKRENVWSISGKNTEKVIFDRKVLTKRELVFVQFLAGGTSLQDAYLNAFEAKIGALKPPLHNVGFHNFV